REWLPGVGRRRQRGDVRRRPLELDDAAGLVGDGAASGLHPPFCAVRARHPMFELVGLASVDAAAHRFLGDETILGFQKLDVVAIGGCEPDGIDAEDTEHLVGPRDAVWFDVPFPTPEAGDAL